VLNGVVDGNWNLITSDSISIGLIGLLEEFGWTK
jgi:hypothetical protein